MRGRRLNDRYELRELIGSGGMGEVWRAHDTRLDRDVAVKLFMPRPGATQDTAHEELLGRFRREARSAAALDSPHIVAVHDHGTDEGMPYLVMALVQGHSLHGVLLERGRAARQDALRWSADVCRALDTAHTAGVVHRDIKPANVMIEGADEESRAKVVDFGIAKFVEDRSSDPQLTMTGQMPFGSVLYMAPEQFRQETVDGRTDLYALGCVLYELLVGRPPYTGTAAGVMFNHLNDTPLRPSRARAELSPAVDRLVLDLMARDPADRPQDAATALARIRELEAAPGSGEPEDPPPQPRPPAPEPLPQSPAQKRPAPRGPAAPRPERPRPRPGAGTSYRKIQAPPGKPVRPAPEKPVRPAPRLPLSPMGPVGPVTKADPGVPPDKHIWRAGEFADRRTISVSEARRSRDARRGRLQIAVGLICLLIIIIVIASSGGSSGADPSSGGQRVGEGQVDPPEEYVLGVAMRSDAAPEERLAKLRTVKAALKKAARDRGERLPLRVRAVTPDDIRRGRKLLTAHPGMVALVGATVPLRATGDSDQAQVPKIDSCLRPPDGPDGTSFGTVAPDADFAEARARYLHSSQGVDKLLIASRALADSGAFGVAGLRSVPADKGPRLSEARAGELLDRHAPDGVLIQNAAASGDLVKAATRRGTRVLLQSRPADTCLGTAAVQRQAKREAELPDGALRLRTFHDGSQRPDCAATPGLCAADAAGPLLEGRGNAELYDATLLAAKAIRSSLTTARGDARQARQAVHDRLPNTTMSGLLGYYRFTDKRVSQRPLWVDRRENGEWHRVATLNTRS